MKRTAADHRPRRAPAAVALDAQDLTMPPKETDDPGYATAALHISTNLMNYNMVEMTSDLVDFNAAQAAQMRYLHEAWPEYGHSLRVAAATSGGMGWKAVKGVEYLVRHYREDGKKKFTSYGRRNEGTEAKLKHFEETTGRARQIVKDQRDDVAFACRLAKAHGLARLPGRQAETLEWFWYTGVTDRLSLFGGAALL